MPAHQLFCFLSLLFGLTPYLAHAQQQCWYPDGKTLATDQPCNSDGSASACCSSGAFCLDNGLCLFQGVVSRGSCTDQSWADPACAQFCRDFYPEGGAAFQPCDPLENTWACGTSNSDCINSQNVFTLASGNGIVLRAAQVAPLQSGSSSAMTILPTTVLEISSSNDTKSGSSSDSAATQIGTVAASSGGAKFTAGDMAGVGAGVGIPLLLALTGAVYVIVRQRRRLHSANTNDQPQRHDHAPMMQNGYGRSHYEDISPQSAGSAPYMQAYYKPGQPPRLRPMNELDGLAERQELGGDLVLK